VIVGAALSFAALLVRPLLVALGLSSLSVVVVAAVVVVGSGWGVAGAGGSTGSVEGTDERKR
jgi:hypothetical protein